MTSDDPERVACDFKVNPEDAIGTSGEIEHGRGGLFCTAEADDVLRPVGGWHIREYGTRVPFCHAHATYLVDEAPAGWEMIALDDLSKLRDVPDERDPVYVTEGTESYHESSECAGDGAESLPVYYAREHWDPCGTCVDGGDDE